MNRPDRSLARAAVAIQHKLDEQTGEPPVAAQLPAGLWDRCRRLCRQWQRANQHGWQLAARRLADQLDQAASELCERLNWLARELRPRSSSSRASATEIYRDLVALRGEFSRVELDRRGRHLAVTTEPIRLENIYLGPFQICLELDGQQLEQYRIVALDPHPSTLNPSVTHPHVQDELLCAGSGHAAIQRALADGRLLDFFHLVAGVLRTYNPRSPFVSLADWDSVECSDCGGRVPAEDQLSCDRCDAAVCPDCSLGCPQCEAVYCSACSGYCQACQSACCPECLVYCHACDVSLCPDCAKKLENNNPDEPRCARCHEQDQQQTQEPHDEDEQDDEQHEHDEHEDSQQDQPGGQRAYVQFGGRGRA